MSGISEHIVSWLGGEANTVAFAILAGVLGFLAKGFYELWMARRRDRLDRLSRQLGQLYGPLYALLLASDRAWRAFRSHYRPGKAFFGTQPEPSKDELEAWRLWMSAVFQPLHDEMFEVIKSNSDLLIDDEVPPVLQDLLAHVSTYRVVFERWKNGDYSFYTSYENYPGEQLMNYVRPKYQELKKMQRALLGAPNKSLERTRER